MCVCLQEWESISFYLGAMSSDEQGAWEREREREEKERRRGEVDDNMTSVGIDECKGGWQSLYLVNWPK